MPRKWLLCLALAVLAPLACDFPTESDEESQVPAVQNTTSASSAGSVSTLTLTPGATKLQVGKTTTLSYSVVYSRGDASEPLPTQLGLSTSLGNFGTSDGGPTTTTPALSFPDSCTSCSASGQVSFYAGSTTGTANLVASVGGTTAPATITIASATSLFINSISPGFGAASGGTQVTITGQGFTSDPQPRVSFGSVLAQFVSVNSDETQIVVNAPQSPSPVSTGSTLVVDVTVDVAATDVTSAQTDTLSGAFTYTAGGGAPPRIPVIQRIEAATTSTNAGDNAGGYEVNIYGTNFIDPVVVKIGSGSSVSSFSGVTTTVDYVNGGQVTITSMPAATPDQLNSSVDILLQNQSSGLGTVAQSAFSYQSPDVLVDIDPTSIVYYEASSTSATVKVRGIDVTSGSSTFDTSRYTLAFGGETQCGTCSLSGPDSSGTYTITVPSLVAVTPSSCTAQSGAATLTDRITTETASGSTFTYEVETPTISNLAGSNDTCSSDPCDSESGGSTLTISGSFSTTELASAQVLIDSRSASFTSSGCSDPASSCTLSVTVPAFTGSFDTASCTASDGSTGTQDQSKQVDVEILYQSTSCSVTRSQAFTYDPLDDSCQVSTSAPTAGFSTVIDANDQLMVQFIDQSTDAASVEWFFGDGDTFLCLEDALPCTVEHAYPTANNYTVTQQVRNSAGSDSASQTIQAGEAPSASISGPSSADTGATVTFFNNSSGIDGGTTCEWDWGDGSTPDVDCGQGVPPALGHSYATADTYTIVFSVSNGLGTDTDTAQVVVSDP